MSTQDLIDYYANLLILQYLGKPKAYATIQAVVNPVVMPQVSIQTITFSAVAVSGNFTLQYGSLTTASIAWDAATSTIQSDLQALAGLSSITVTGSISSQSLTVTFTSITPPALLLTVPSSSLEDAGSNIVQTIIQAVDQTLPLAVQGAFNLLGSNQAVGVQLDVLGKYQGVSRSGLGFGGAPVTLDDSDFLRLINMAIILNSAGSSLATIQQLINQFFPGDILVFDYQNMQMSFLINSTTISNNLAGLFISEGLLPIPMAVSYSIIYYPVINAFFGFRTYPAPGHNNSPFNDYASYQTNWPWLSYNDSISEGFTDTFLSDGDGNLFVDGDGNFIVI